MRLGVLRVLFVVLVVVWSLIFWGSGFLGHFRSARSGVYMVSRRTDSVIRFGVLVEWMDAQEGGRIEGQETQARGKVRTEGSGLATAQMRGGCMC